MGAYEAQVNVAIEKTASPSTVMPGEIISFTLTLSNNGSITATAAYTIVLPNIAPAFTSTPVVSATENTLYTYMVAIEDANGDVLIITTPTLPVWLSVLDHGNGTAALTGTPGTAHNGIHLVVLRVTDSDGLYAEQSFTITVNTGFSLYPLMLMKNP